MLYCPHCGWSYDPVDEKWQKQHPQFFVPTHNFPKLCRAVCPGAKQTPLDHHPGVSSVDVPLNLEDQ